MTTPQVVLFPYSIHRIAGISSEVLQGMAGDFQPCLDVEQTNLRALETAQTALLGAFDHFLSNTPEGAIRTKIYNIRKEFFQKKELKLAQLAALETIESLSNVASAWKEAKATHLEGIQRADAYYEDVLLQNWTFLQQFSRQNDSFQRALLFASHELLVRIPSFAACDVATIAKSDRKTGLSLLQYLTRMAMKTSPLSRFTSVAYTVANETKTDQPFIFPWEQESLESSPSLISKVVPNVAFLEPIYAVLLPLPVVYRALSLRVNPSLRRDVDSLRWWYFDGSTEAIQQAPSSPLIEFALDFFENNRGRSSFSALRQELREALEQSSADEVEATILGWVDYGLLEWELPENGLTHSWCGNLYQWLGFLPEGSRHEAITDTAFLLQWLRTAARTFPFSSVQEGFQMQRDALAQLQAYFEKYGIQTPPIPPEQVFYEDTRTEIDQKWSQADVADWCGQIAPLAVHPQLKEHGLKHRMLQWWDQYFESKGPVDFLDFTQAFLSDRAPITEDNALASDFETVKSPTHFAALVQPFCDENGEWCCVVNHVLPGGGKMIARWSHLFPESLRTALQDWAAMQAQMHVFPWFGFYNANFQPNLRNPSVGLPGGKISGSKGFSSLLSNLRIWKNKYNQLQINDILTEKPVQFLDLALEGIATRPPTMQALLVAGLPSVSLQIGAADQWQSEGEGWQIRARIQIGRVVVQRSAWRIEGTTCEQWLKQTNNATFWTIKNALQAHKVPRYFFVRWPNQPPQFVDQESPVMMLLLEKELRLHTNQTLMIEECLPLPGSSSSDKATELVLEWKMDH